MQYFSLPPHRQLLVGVGMLMVIAFFGQFILLVGVFLLATLLFGRPVNSLVTNMFSFILAGGLLVLFSVAIVVPIVRLLQVSHRYGKQYGRGDEHISFYIGTLLLIAGVIATRLIGISSGVNPRPFQIVSSLGSLIIGILLIGISVFLLCRLSARVYRKTS